MTGNIWTFYIKYAKISSLCFKADTLFLKLWEELKYFLIYLLSKKKYIQVSNTQQAYLYALQFEIATKTIVVKEFFYYNMLPYFIIYIF